MRGKGILAPGPLTSPVIDILSIQPGMTETGSLFCEEKKKKKKEYRDIE